LWIKNPWQPKGSKFCDRATLCINEAGEVLIVLTEEYKTAGVKAADRNVQQGRRNVRLNDPDLSPDAILTCVNANGDVVEVFLSDLRLHVENPGNQLGVQASSRSNTIDVRGTKPAVRAKKPGAVGDKKPDVRKPNPDEEIFEEVYIHTRVPWPGGPDLRRVLQTVLATLPKAKP
jgi:hypothetical protein